jgi:hypothetical protein
MALSSFFLRSLGVTIPNFVRKNTMTGSENNKTVPNSNPTVGPTYEAKSKFVYHHVADPEVGKKGNHPLAKDIKSK